MTMRIRTREMRYMAEKERFVIFMIPKAWLPKLIAYLGRIS